MYAIKVRVTAPTMHAMCLSTQDTYLSVTASGADVVEDITEATTFGGYLEADDYVEEWSTDSGIESMEVVEI